MSTEPYPSWDELLNRKLQSWRDSAARQARRPMFADDRPCDECRSDPCVIVARLEDDSAAHGWPHWMRRTLREHLIPSSTELGSAHVTRGTRRHGSQCRSRVTRRCSSTCGCATGWRRWHRGRSGCGGRLFTKEADHETIGADRDARLSPFGSPSRVTSRPSSGAAP